MRTLLITLAIGLASALLASPPPAAHQESSEWTDLFAHDVRDWSRSESGPSPWRLTADRTLTCEPSSEILVPEREFADGTLRFEYRFRPMGKRATYRAAFWARRTLEQTGCKVELGDECGCLNAIWQGGSDRVKTFEEKPARNPARPIGSWNEVRVELHGRSVEVFINDHPVVSFNDCDTQKGLFALETDGSEVEFRHVMWKEAR